MPIVGAVHYGSCRLPFNPSNPCHQQPSGVPARRRFFNLARREETCLPRRRTRNRNWRKNLKKANKPPQKPRVLLSKHVTRAGDTTAKRFRETRTLTPSHTELGYQNHDEKLQELQEDHRTPRTPRGPRNSKNSKRTTELQELQEDHWTPRRPMNSKNPFHIVEWDAGSQHGAEMGWFWRARCRQQKTAMSDLQLDNERR